MRDFIPIKDFLWVVISGFIIAFYNGWVSKGYFTERTRRGNTMNPTEQQMEKQRLERSHRLDVYMQYIILCILAMTLLLLVAEIVR